MTKKRASSKTFPKEGEDKLKETNQKLKSKNRKLEKEIKRLKSELMQLNQVFHKNIDRIQELSDEKRLADVLEMEEELVNDGLSETDVVRLKFAREFSGGKLDE